MCNELHFLAKKSMSRKRGIDFTLTFMQFSRLHETKECYYCGKGLQRAIGCKQNHNSRTLERLNDNRGYTPRNTVAVCYECNMFKNELKNRAGFLEGIKKMLPLLEEE